MVKSQRPSLLQQLAITAMLALALLASAPALSQQDAPRLAEPQLEQLVAPIALYPDAMLSQVLMAATYPLEVVEAARWSSTNSGVTGEALEDAMQRQKWDPSVKALTSVPQTLAMMNDKLDWTQQLGDAFLSQQEDVLAAVQRLRARADAAGNLKDNEHQKVTRVEPSSGAAAPAAGGGVAAAPAPLYTIEPVNPEQFAVPVYDPGVVYGAWPYANYQPFYWTPPAYAGYGAFGYAAAAAVTGAAIWGGVDWYRNRVNVNVNNYNRFNRTNVANANWTHNPAHRGNAPYRDRNTAQRFGDQSKAASRDAFRGKADAGRRAMAGQNARTKAGNAKAGAAGLGNNAAGARQIGAKQGGAATQAGAKQAGAKQAAKGTQAARGQNQKAAHANQGVRSKQAARPSTARPSQAARPQRAAAARPQAAARGGMPHGGGMSRPAAMRGGGGFQGRGGGVRGGGRRR